MYFEIAGYFHAEGMYGCVTWYLVLYMRSWSTFLFFMKPSLPGSLITQCVRYPDRLVPGMYVVPTPTGYRNVRFPVCPLPNAHYPISPCTLYESFPIKKEIRVGIFKANKKLSLFKF